MTEEDLTGKCSQWADYRSRSRRAVIECGNPNRPAREANHLSLLPVPQFPLLKIREQKQLAGARRAPQEEWMPPQLATLASEGSSCVIVVA